MADISNFKRIAIIQTAFLGDVVLSLPLIQNIRNSSPSSEITLLTTPAGVSLGYIAKAVDKVTNYDKRGIHSGIKGIKHAAMLLKENGTDCIIGLHRSLRSSLITFYTKPKFSVGFSNAALSLIYKKRVSYQKQLHEIDRNIELLSVFKDIDITTRELKDIELINLNEESDYIHLLLRQNGLTENDIIIAIAPGSIWATKRWHPEHYIELSRMINSYGYKAVIIGSKDDADLCNEIANRSGSVSIAGEATIPQTICFLRQAQTLVTNDSAPTHFAGLAGCKCITIFGPTSPQFGFAPRGEKDVVLQDDSLKCKPCRIHGSKKCPIDTLDCMTNITPEMAFEEILKN
jgi:heptosyltransferase II